MQTDEDSRSFSSLRKRFSQQSPSGCQAGGARAALAGWGQGGSASLSLGLGRTDTVHGECDNNWGMEQLPVQRLIKAANLTSLATALFPLNIPHAGGNFPPLPAHTHK